MSMKKFLPAAAALAAGALLLIFPKEMSQAVSSSCKDCLEIIIPSLFPFTVLAVFLQKSGLYRTALKPLTFPLSKLLGANEELCALILLSNIGGYPVGARLLSAEVRSGRLSRESAGKLLCCCFGSGPSFVIGLAGLRVFGSAAVGAVIYCACVLSSLIIARFVCAGGKISISPPIENQESGAECFISSVTDGARVMFTVCAMIVGFAAVTRIIELTGFPLLFERLMNLIGAGKNSAAVFPALMEISRVREFVPTGAWVLPFAAAALSFGGICVQMQIAALAGDIPLKPLLLSRIPAAAMSALFSLPALFLPQSAAPAIADGTAVRATASGGVLSLCVVAMSSILLMSAEKPHTDQAE